MTETKNIKGFKEGDWCFCDFELQQITEIKDGLIKETKNGYLSHGGHDLTDDCFPLDLSVKNISQTVMGWRNRFHNIKNNSLNYPDLNRKLIGMWRFMCENKDDVEALRELYDELDDFGNSIVQATDDLSTMEVGGVKLFRN
jgi:hypothetical protein